MAGNTVNSEIQRLKQNVSDAYTAIEQNMGKEVTDTNSDYMNENISEIGKHLQAVMTDDTVTMDINLDEYEVIDLTNLDGILQDKTIKQNGMSTYDAGYKGLRNVFVALDIDEKPDVITANGTYISSVDNLAGYSSVVVDVSVNNENRTFTQNGVYTPTEGYDGIYQVTVDVPASTYLNNIRTVLVNQGLTPPEDDADLATYIDSVFNNIATELQSINDSTTGGV